MPQRWDFGVLGGLKTLVWGVVMEPHQLHILVDIPMFYVNYLAMEMHAGAIRMVLRAYWR